MLILSGLSLYFLQESKQQRIKNIGKYLAIIVVLTTALQIIGFFVPIDFNIDQLLFTKKLQGNRIALYGLINFLLCGSSLLLINDHRKGNGILSQLLAFFVLIISTLAITGYLYTAQSVHHIKMQKVETISIISSAEPNSWSNKFNSNPLNFKYPTIMGIIIPTGSSFLNTLPPIFF